jgi:hypothetical protein
MEIEPQHLLLKSNFQTCINLNFQTTKASHWSLRIRPSELLGLVLFTIELTGLVSDARLKIPLEQQSARFGENKKHNRIFLRR